ncbi:MAG: malto-oligosyltrehalose synthase, partial [Burkholderiales bacterium]
LNVLANRLWRIAQASRDTRDFTLNSLRQALEEVIASFPVYRTYIVEQPSDDDRRFIEWAIAQAKNRNRAVDVTVFDFVREVLLINAAEGRAPEIQAAVRAFAGKFQQLTGPVTAKGLEDTTFYIYNRLVSLNEVGGNPMTFGFTVSAFHGASQDRAVNWPHTMLATSTHDSKRSEDVRARINVLTEIPALWRLSLSRLARAARSRKQIVDGEPAPSRNDEYLLYQVLLGTWPLEPMDSRALSAYRERIRNYMIKAVRESKVRSSWVSVNESYETGVSQFVDSVLRRKGRNPFLDEIDTLARRVSWLGMLNSLSITFLKFASPGVPDIYQGNELWNFALVDPDNRGAVDFGQRSAALEAIRSELAPGAPDRTARARALLDSLEDGRAKLFVTWRMLQLHAEWPEAFMQGEYVAVNSEGECADHVVAFARRGVGRTVIAVAPRLMNALVGEARGLPLGPGVWRDTQIDLSFLGVAVQLENTLTGERFVPQTRDGRLLLPLAQVLASFPVALIAYRTE